MRRAGIGARSWLSHSSIVLWNGALSRGPIVRVQCQTVCTVDSPPCLPIHSWQRQCATGPSAGLSGPYSDPIGTPKWSGPALGPLEWSQGAPEGPEGAHERTVRLTALDRTRVNSRTCLACQTRFDAVTPLRAATACALCMRIASHALAAACQHSGH